MIPLFQERREGPENNCFGRCFRFFFFYSIPHDTSFAKLEACGFDDYLVHYILLTFSH